MHYPVWQEANQMISVLISMVDGKNVLNSDAMIQAFDFYSGLVQDGSFHPDSVNRHAPATKSSVCTESGRIPDSGFLVYLNLGKRKSGIRIWCYGNAGTR